MWRGPVDLCFKIQPEPYHVWANLPSREGVARLLRPVYEQYPRDMARWIVDRAYPCLSALAHHYSDGQGEAELRVALKVDSQHSLGSTAVIGEPTQDRTVWDKVRDDEV